MNLPEDYLERVYAAVLGKIIGVYLGRPFEGWTHQRIARELGDITWYVHDRLGQPLVVTDDDITGTFTFLRALPDHENRPGLTSREIGRTWLNYIIEGRTILWWGGMGESTEHTAYLRLKGGMEAPRSGSVETNGRTVAEQIGAEIFADGWALVSPGDPAMAARLAGEAARVSHDGEAVFAAQVIAAMEAAAFLEEDIDRLIDAAVRLIPAGSAIRRVVDQVRQWCAQDGDWRRTRALIEENYGYARYGGHVPVVSNFAIVLMALILGRGSFQESLMIANTSGWDTDCNSGNVGCLLGIRAGLSIFDGQPDWRGPVADRMYMPTADGGRAITDAVQEACRVAAIGRALAGEKPAPGPKSGARFHFELPGALQGFTAEAPVGASIGLANTAGHSGEGGRRLAVRWESAAEELRVTTPTFIPPDALSMKGYELLASPTLYSGQTISLRVEVDAGNAAPALVSALVKLYGRNDEQERLSSPAVVVRPGESADIKWTVPDTEGRPVFAVGIKVASEAGQGTVYLDYLTWTGTPRVTFKRPAGGGELWRRAWVNAFDHHGTFWPEAFRLSQDRGTGMHITGSREWVDYRASSEIASDMAADFGLAVRVQGLRRYYALVVTGGGRVELRKVLHEIRVLGRAAHRGTGGPACAFSLQAIGDRITASIDGQVLFDVVDRQEPLEGGGIALVCTEGSISTNEVRVEPV
jgi:ADP-ribosylglycohydrolase